MSNRSYLSIGEVLTLLRQEFPDVTISKIRFLEAQGLVNPERTPSGYRKFYEHDVDRLRWVLVQQREHFLPLKVIKGRLHGDTDADDAVAAADGVEAAGAEAVGGAAAPAGGVAPSAAPTAAAEAVDQAATASAPARTLDDVVEAARAASRACVLVRQGLAPDGSPAATGASSPAGRPANSADGASDGVSDGAAGVVAEAALPGFEQAAAVAAVRAADVVELGGVAAPLAAGDPDGSSPGDQHAGRRTAPESAASRPAAASRQGGAGRGGAAGAHPRPAPPAPTPAKPAPRPHLAAAPATEAPHRPPDGAGSPPAAAGAGADEPAANALAANALAANAPAGVELTTGASLSLEELAAAAECSAADVGQLEAFGLLTGRVVGGVVHYDERALEVAWLATAFARFGVEARHLRLYKNAADREAGFIEQLVVPLLKQRNPAARQRANETAAELSRLGQGLRAALVRASLQRQLGG